MNHFVDIDNRDQQPIDEVQAIFFLLQSEPTTPRGDLDAVVDKDLEELFQTQCVGLTADECHGIDREALFQWGEAIELLENKLRVKAGFHRNDQSKAVSPVGEVVNVTDALNFLGHHAFFDLFDHPLRSHQIGKFRDHKPLAARADLFHGHPGAGLKASSPAPVSIGNSVATHDDAACGQIRPGDNGHQRVDIGIG